MIKVALLTRAPCTCIGCGDSWADALLLLIAVVLSSVTKHWHVFAVTFVFVNVRLVPADACSDL